jgi:hypothetical protein
MVRTFSTSALLMMRVTGVSFADVND